MNTKDELLQHYDYIRRLAESKCSTPQDAEDLLSETFLAAYAYLYRGGSIEHPKTWLANTFMHKWNGFLRKKYRQPVVEYDTLALTAPETEDAFISSEEAEQVRKRLIYLSKTTREVLIRYYYNGSSVQEIANSLGIPEGTVKSRLSAGRDNIKKGLTEVKIQKNHVPGGLYISYSGSSGPNFQKTVNAVFDDLIAQNLLLVSYEKPLSAVEISEVIGIPTVYIEPKLERLVDYELMKKTDGNRYFTDFVISYPYDGEAGFEDLLEFVNTRFDKISAVIKEIPESIDALEYASTLNPRQLKKLERYTIMLALQRFQQLKSGNGVLVYPKRRDGGSWIALGFAFPPGYDHTAKRPTDGYTVLGGHRTVGETEEFFAAKELRLCEFDTDLWDNTGRFNICGMETYFKEIYRYLWCIYNNISPEQAGISNGIIENTQRLIDSTGLIIRENGEIKVDIAVLDKVVYRKIEEIVSTAVEKLDEYIGRDFGQFLDSSPFRIPKQIQNVIPSHRKNPSAIYFVMACVRKAYETGVHLHDVNYCCPPVVLVYDK